MRHLSPLLFLSVGLFTLAFVGAEIEVSDNEKTSDASDTSAESNDTSPATHSDSNDFDAEPEFGSPKFDQHMRETIADEFGEPVPAEYTGKAYYYYYFKAHDDDRNSKLDKKELLKALVHLVLPPSNYNGYPREDPEMSGEGDGPGVPWEVELICQDSVDRIIRKDDKNKDGFIDPLEYQNAKSRGLKAMKKSIDKQLKQHGSRGRFY
ncbi:multiple coagulation factor deficiency protein 2 homolog [Galendromus occidentalis]|uniref:Multiple coagulation factor deficiency protein 2 homolog n=1 Tax=Galendromus occidentalis TaxID=34638 RepID=A0AAJ7PAS1_9ACAR|nr:multiple coagulation factor deficiency protein 2 homolog [Galendromus occidentalis]